MSKRVYVSRDILVPPAQEDTPVRLRIQVSAATVKALHARSLSEKAPGESSRVAVGQMTGDNASSL